MDLCQTIINSDTSVSPVVMDFRSVESRPPISIRFRKLELYTIAYLFVSPQATIFTIFIQEPRYELSSEKTRHLIC